MKLMEIQVSPPGKEEIKARTNIAEKIIKILLRADTTDVKHNELFSLADKAVGKQMNFSPLELEQDSLIHSTLLRMITNSPLNIVKLNSILKQMEKISRRG